MVTGNPCSNGRIRLIKYPSLKQAFSVSCIKAGIEHDDFLHNTKLTEYSLNNQKIIKDLLFIFIFTISIKSHKLNVTKIYLV